MSETPIVPKVYAAISAVTAELAKEGISKDRHNVEQKFKFRGIDDLYNAIAPILAKNRLCILPRISDRQITERQTRSGGTLAFVILRGDFDFVSAEDGSRHTVSTYGEAMDSGDKATNKAMSAAMKYACLMAFCIPTAGDNDADATTHEPVRQPAAATAAPPTKPASPPPDPAAAWATALCIRMEGIATTDAMHDLAVDQRVVKGRAKLTATRPELASLIQDSERAMFERVGAAEVEGDGWPGPVPGETKMEG